MTFAQNPGEETHRGLNVEMKKPKLHGGGMEEEKKKFAQKNSAKLIPLHNLILVNLK